MAFINKNVSTMAMPSGMNRMGQFPLDMSSVYYDEASLKAYAESGAIAYVGQIVSLVDETKGTVTVYSIQDTAGTLKEVGSVPMGDDLSIDVADGKVKLHDFGTAYYKYVPEVKDEETDEVITPASYERVEVSEENPWKAGLEPKLVSHGGQLVIGWYEPNPTTIEGVNDQVTAVQGSVADIENEIGTPATEDQPATGIYKEIEDVDVKVEELSDSVGSESDSLNEDVNTIWAHVNNHTDRIEALEEKEDKDTTYTVASGEKVLKLTGTEFSTEISIKHENGRISLTGVDGTEIAGFATSDFTKDSFLENVDYDEATKSLVFTWNTESGISIDTVDISDFVDTYTASGVEGTTVKVTASTTDNVHTVSAEVVEGSLKNVHIAADAAIEQSKIAGLVDNLANKLEANALTPYAKTEDISDSLAKAESAVQPDALDAYVTSEALGTTLEGYATDNELQAVSDKADSNANSITNLTGRLDGIVAQGGEPNTINTIKVNNVAQAIAEDKSVNITVPTKFTDITDDSGFDARITAAQNKADEGVTKAGEANVAAAAAQSKADEAFAKAAANTESIGAHTSRLVALEQHDTEHAAEFTTLNNIVTTHSETLAAIPGNP